ncbi:hypothetical protein JCM10207_006062 [Rhodosporidiobolus poonsookiae]
MAASGLSAPSTALLSRLQAAHEQAGLQSLSLELLDELHLALSSESSALATTGTDIENTLFNDPFPLLSALLPVCSASPASQASTTSARTSLLLVAEHSSAKEVVLALDERVSELKMPEDSDEEEAWEEAHTQSDAGGAAPWDPRDAAVQLATIVDMYKLALLRTRTPRPLKFLSPIVEPLVMAVGQLALEGAFRERDKEGGLSASQPEPDEEDFGGADSVALKLLESVSLFTQAVSSGTWLDGAGKTTEEASFRPQSLLDPLGYSPSNLSVFLSSRFSPQHSRIGAFALLVHLLASPTFSSDDVAELSASETLSAALSVIKMPFEQPLLRVGEDEVVFFCWSLCERAIEREGGLENEVLFPLIEILSTLSALSPIPQTRFLSFRLITHLLLRGIRPSSPSAIAASTSASDSVETTQLILLKSLVDKSPFPQLRVAAIGLVRELLEGKLGEADAADAADAGKTGKDEESLTASPSLLLSLLARELPSLFRLPDLPASASSPSSAPQPISATTCSPDEFVENAWAATMERLKLVLVWTKRDGKNRTGLLSPASLASLRSTLLAPLRTLLTAYLLPSTAVSEPASSTASAAEDASAGKAAVRLNADVQLQLELLEDMLSRVEEAVEGVAR